MGLPAAGVAGRCGRPAHLPHCARAAVGNSNCRLPRARRVPLPLPGISTAHPVHPYPCLPQHLLSPLAGMESWQKKLNEVLRLSNSFANAGAIPKEIVRRGEKAKAEYMAERAANMPSSAQWVFEQALLQHHSYLQDVREARDLARKEGRTIQWETFATYWRRYMVAATFRHRLLARVRRGATRRAKAGVPMALGCVSSEYDHLMQTHRNYYAPVEFSAPDLDPVERAKQEDRGRRLRYAELHEALK